MKSEFDVYTLRDKKGLLRGAFLTRQLAKQSVDKLFVEGELVILQIEEAKNIKTEDLCKAESETSTSRTQTA